MELLVVRHAKTIANAQGDISGQSFAPLTENAFIETYLLAAKLMKSNIDTIYSSDLLRARQTAQRLRIQLSVQGRINYSKNLREINYGALEGKNKLLVMKDNPRFHRDPNYVAPNGESFSQLQTRVERFMKRIRGKTILIVAHAGTIRAFYAIFAAKQASDVINMHISNAVILQCELVSKKKKATFLAR